MSDLMLMQVFRLNAFITTEEALFSVFSWLEYCTLHTK